MYYIGVDLGGTNIAAGLVSEEGKLLYKESVPTLSDRGSGAVLDDLTQLCVNIMEKHNLQTKDIKSIGVGSPGICDNENGYIVYSNNLHFENVPAREIIQGRIKLPLYLANDANCAALGEYTDGATKGYKQSITITLGTGIGGGVVIDGKLLIGSFNGGAELGHHVIHMNGEQCTCGRKGCWEAYASASALIRDARAALKDSKALTELAKGKPELIQAKTVFDAANSGDATAKRLINDYLRYVAEGLANMINIFQPDIVAVGGGICAQGEAILQPLRQHVKKMVFGSDFQTEIVVAKLGNDAGIIGAAMLT